MLRVLRVIYIKGSIQGREVNIAINMTQDENYININLANQLLIPESNIIEKEDIFRKKQYEIKELQVTIDDYEYISQFNVTQDTTMKSDSIIPSSKDLKDLSKVILQENQWSISKMQKEFDEVITDKNEEISRLKDHSKKLLTQIKKSKDRKQCIQKLEQENQDLEKNLSEKNEENSHLKNLNQGLLEQIRKLKEEKLENPDIKDIDKSDNEENSHLKNHNQNLLMQIKKLKNDKRLLENKLEQIQKEASKSSGVKIQVVEKGTNTDPIHITAQEDANPVEEKTYRDVGVQTMGTPSVRTNRSSSINQATSMHEENHIPKLNQENTTSMIRENNVIRTPYRHPNHKRRYLKQSEYQYHLGREQLNYHPKNIDTDTIKSHDNSSSWKCNVPQRIELGWSDPFTVRKFCSTLRGSYRLVSSTTTEQRMMR
jgi:hypothetical protein